MIDSIINYRFLERGHINEKKFKFEDVVHTFEYFAAYVAVQALSLIPDDIKIPNKMILVLVLCCTLCLGTAISAISF